MRAWLWRLPWAILRSQYARLTGSDWIVPGVVEGLIPRKDDDLPAPRNYPEELGERAVRLCLDALKDPDRAKGCLGADRGRAGRQRRDAARPGSVRPRSTKEHEPGPPRATRSGSVSRGRENRELRRANAIRCAPRLFSRRSTGRHWLTYKFIDSHKERFGAGADLAGS